MQKLILWISLFVLSCLNSFGVVSAFRRRFGIFSAVTAAAGNGNSSRNDWLGHDNDEEEEEEEGREHDDDDEEEWLDDALHPLLQIPAALALSGVLYTDPMDVRTFLDTGAMRTVMSWRMAQRLGVAQHLDRRYSGQATGIGSTRVLGRLPAGLFVMHLSGGQTTVHSPAITILESTGLPGVELLLGLDFLREYRAVLDLRVNQVRLLVDGQECAVPFVRSDNDVDDRRSEEYDWDGNETKFHCDTAQLYDERYYVGDDDDEYDQEDWPDMSGI